MLFVISGPNPAFFRSLFSRADKLGFCLSDDLA
jgi:hypothetical protein